MGRRQLRVAVRPKKIRYGPGSSCAVLSQAYRADFAAFVKILMTAQKEVSQEPTKRSKKIIDRKQKGSLNRGSFVFIKLLQKFMNCFLSNIIYDSDISLS